MNIFIVTLPIDINSLTLIAYKKGKFMNTQQMLEKIKIGSPDAQLIVRYEQSENGLGHKKEYFYGLAKIGDVEHVIIGEEEVVSLDFDTEDVIKLVPMTTRNTPIKFLSKQDCMETLIELVYEKLESEWTVIKREEQHL